MSQAVNIPNGTQPIVYQSFFRVSRGGRQAVRTR